ncbi:MAG: hypothetical protein R2844_02590 [Caldilineales bacterium]
MKQYYVVLLRKGPGWTPDESPELDELQRRHLAHLAAMQSAGMMHLAGPVDLHDDGDIRGISVFSYDVFRSLDDLRYGRGEGSIYAQAGRHVPSTRRGTPTQRPWSAGAPRCVTDPQAVNLIET